MSIENISKDRPNNTQLHITDIKCYCTHNNKEQDSHNHCILCHSNKTYYCKKHNCLGLFMNRHHNLVVCIDGICCHWCQGRIQRDIECRKMESYSKYNLKEQINKSDMCCQCRDNTHPDIVNIECCWDSVNNLECYQNRSNICDRWYPKSSCLDRQCKLTKSCIIGIRECLLRIWDKFHFLSPSKTYRGMLCMWMNRYMCNNHSFINDKGSTYYQSIPNNIQPDSMCNYMWLQYQVHILSIHQLAIHITHSLSYHLQNLIYSSNKSMHCHK